MENSQRYSRDTHLKKLPTESAELIDSCFREKCARRLLFTVELEWMNEGDQCLTGGSWNPLGSEGVMETSFNSSIARKYIITNSQCPLQGDTGNIW